MRAKLAQLTAQIYAMSPEQRQRHAQKIREVEARLKKLPDWLRAVYKDELAQLVGKDGRRAAGGATHSAKRPPRRKNPLRPPCRTNCSRTRKRNGVQMSEEPEELPAQEEEDAFVKKPARRKKKTPLGLPCPGDAVPGGAGRGCGACHVGGQRHQRRPRQRQPQQRPLRSSRARICPASASSWRTKRSCAAAFCSACMCR